MAQQQSSGPQGTERANGYCACQQGFGAGATFENVFCGGGQYRTCKACCNTELPNPIPTGLNSGGGSSGTIVRPIRPTMTGQPVQWRKQSGTTDEGTILGLTTTQLLIAGAVGVGAYLLIKKKK